MGARQAYRRSDETPDRCEAMLQLHLAGMPYTEIARQHQLTWREAWRMVQKAKRARVDAEYQRSINGAPS